MQRYDGDHMNDFLELVRSLVDQHRGVVRWGREMLTDLEKLSSEIGPITPDRLDGWRRKFEGALEPKPSQVNV